MLGRLFFHVHFSRDGENILYNEQELFGLKLGLRVWDVYPKFACRPLVGVVLRTVVHKGY